MKERFCYITNIRGGRALPCSVATFNEITHSQQVREVCEKIAVEMANALKGYEKRVAELKKQLPAFCWHAQSFAGGRRANNTARPSGLTMLDVDHVDNPGALFEHIIASLGQHDISLTDSSIYLIATTPSGHGLRIVAEREINESLEDAQKRIANLCGIDTFDEVTKDLARLSFAVPFSYIHYLNPSGLEFQTQEEAEKWAGITFEQPAQQADLPLENMPEEASEGSQLPQAGPNTLTYEGIPYEKIVQALIRIMGGSASQGGRNRQIFDLAVNLRYITDFDANILMRIIPDYGYARPEFEHTIRSAVSRPRKSQMPDLITRAIIEAQADEQQVEMGEVKAAFSTDDLSLPQLPRVLQLITSVMPESFRPAMVIAALPILGTLATKVRFNYLDGQQHSFSFFSVITAPAATGKSFIRKPINLLLTPIDEQDEIERAKEQEYKQALKACRNRQKQPDDPHACPRNNGVNISIAKLLQLLTYAEGKHLIGIGEEIDTLVKSERAGAWSQKSDIYRLAFDNAKYGQNYMSDNSFSANVPVYYNMLLTGTPDGMYRFFKDVEDGLVTRVAFAQLPDMFGAAMPDFHTYTSRQEEQIISIARWLEEQEGNIVCLPVQNHISNWLEQKRLLAIENSSRAIDTVRRRAAVMGYRAGMLAFLLNKRLYTAAVGEFAIWVAEYVFRQQMALFGDKFEEVGARQENILGGRTSTKNLLAMLPAEFTAEQVMRLRSQRGQSTNVRTIICRWIQAGFVENVGKNKYRKTTFNG